MFERSGLGAGGGGGSVAALPGTVGGDLARRAGDFVRVRDLTSGGGGGSPTSVPNLTELARANGTIDDAEVRQELAAALHAERDRPVHQPAPAGDAARGR